MYPKPRIDALTDGVFAVAMTILVLDLRLPDGFHPDDQIALGQALRDLFPKFFPYVVSFYVLGSNWLANVKLRSRGEFVNKHYAFVWLLYLLLATCLPFSTSVVGKFAQYSLAVWLYSLNMAALAAASYVLFVLLPDRADDEHSLDRKVSIGLLIATAVLCAGLSLISGQKALWVYVVNAGASPLTRWIGARRKQVS
jgi:TMEM175 potassium channel family protein